MPSYPVVFSGLLSHVASIRPGRPSPLWTLRNLGRTVLCIRFALHYRGLSCVFLYSLHHHYTVPLYVVCVYVSHTTRGQLTYLHERLDAVLARLLKHRAFVLTAPHEHVPTQDMSWPICWHRATGYYDTEGCGHIEYERRDGGVGVRLEGRIIRESEVDATLSVTKVIRGLDLAQSTLVATVCIGPVVT
ncbi:hypothetical protein GGR57DRAFT_251004 [Xylariaceae sp. FL1272]|nr:hypothetical protein GGR57DRAFT_251004 [Xylariaceae sp. FL1272]